MGNRFYKEPLEQRFWKKVAKGSPDECWEWTACRQKAGYGRFGIAVADTRLAHRVAWELANGKAIPEGVYILHRCDNPPCCNPAHLFVGTPKDNVDDMTQKGRRRSWNPRGEDHPRARLSNADVAEIRRLRAEGVPGVTLAFRYGVTPTQICRIHKRTSRI